MFSCWAIEIPIGELIAESRVEWTKALLKAAYSEYVVHRDTVSDGLQLHELCINAELWRF